MRNFHSTVVKFYKNIVFFCVSVICRSISTIQIAMYVYHVVLCCITNLNLDRKNFSLIYEVSEEFYDTNFVDDKTGMKMVQMCVYCSTCFDCHSKLDRHSSI